MPPPLRLEGAEVTGARGPDKDYPERELTEKIIGCAIHVHRELGPGFLESIYENALARALNGSGLRFERQKVVKVFFDGVEVGEHRIDLFVENSVVVELKSVEVLTNRHMAQVISTLKAARTQVGLLLNFDAARLVDGIRRVVLTRS